MFCILGESSKVKFQKICDQLDEAGYTKRIGDGRYKGVIELSVIVSQSGEDEYTFIQDMSRIAKAAEQESILLVSDKGAGTLMFPHKDGSHEFEEIGIIKRITQEEAFKVPNYSHFGQQYFVFGDNYYLFR